MSRQWRVAIVVLGAVAAGLLYVALRDADSDAPARTTTGTATTATTVRQTEIVVQINAERSDIMRVPIPRGRRVVLEFRGRAGDEAHLHGYDRKAVIPGRIVFRATIAGRFEIELEESHRQIAELTVSP